MFATKVRLEIRFPVKDASFLGSSIIYATRASCNDYRQNVALVTDDDIFYNVGNFSSDNTVREFSVAVLDAFGNVTRDISPKQHYRHVFVVNDRESLHLEDYYIESAMAFRAKFEEAWNSGDVSAQRNQAGPLFPIKWKGVKYQIPASAKNDELILLPDRTLLQFDAEDNWPPSSKSLRPKPHPFHHKDLYEIALLMLATTAISPP